MNRAASLWIFPLLPEFLAGNSRKHEKSSGSRACFFAGENSGVAEPFTHWKPNGRFSLTVNFLKFPASPEYLARPERARARARGEPNGSSPVSY